jgi:hypothetical protein
MVNVEREPPPVQKPPVVQRHLDDHEVDRLRRERQEREKAEREAAERETQERRRKEEEQARRQRQRQLIQKAKDQVVANFVGSTRIPEEVQAQVYLEIERTLSVISIDEFPWSEVRGIAEGVWMKLTRPVVKAVEDHERQEKERQEEERQQQQDRKALIDAAKRYAEVRLKDVRGLDYIARVSAVAQVEEALSREVTGDECENDLEEIVHMILDPIEEEAEDRADKEERGRRKVELVRHGGVYARKEIESVEDLPLRDRLWFQGKVNRVLEEELDGSESQDEVEDIVDDILDEELEESE